MYKNRYSFEDFNKYNVLKTPWLLLFAIIYLLKHFFLAFIPVMALLPKMRMEDMSTMLVDFAHSVTTTELLLSCIPAMLVFGALGNRLPKTKPDSLYRKIWHNGRLLLLISIILELILVGFYLLIGWKPLNEYTLAILYIDLMLAIYIWRAQRVKDVFADFPDYQQ
jgi:hypothetical protein